jgi:enoyl-CoA hydratase
LATGLADRAGTLAEAITWAEEIATFAPLTLAYNKRILNGVADAAEIERRFGEIWGSQDAEESANARVERRLPRFSGR